MELSGTGRPRLRHQSRHGESVGRYGALAEGERAESQPRVLYDASLIEPDTALERLGYRCVSRRSAASGPFRAAATKIVEFGHELSKLSTSQISGVARAVHIRGQMPISALHLAGESP